MSKETRRLKGKALMGLTTVLVTSVGLTGCNKAEKISDYIMEGKYKEAYEAFSGWKYDAEDRKELVTLLDQDIDAVVKAYAEESLDYDNAQMRISAISNLYLSELDASIGMASGNIRALSQSKSAFMQAGKSFSAGNYLDAYHSYLQVIEMDTPNYETAKAKVEESKTAYIDQVLAKAKELTDADNYDGALKELRTAQNYFPEEAQLTKQIETVNQQFEEYKKAQARAVAVEEAEAFIKQEDYESALTRLNQFKEEWGEDAEIDKVAKGYTDKYVAMIVEKAEALRSDGKYLKALEMLNNAKEVVQSKSFDDLIEKINKEKPTYLAEVKRQNEDRFEQITEGDALVDTLGNTYEPGNLFVISSQDGGWGDDHLGYGEYYLGYKYNHLHGVIATDDRSKIGQGQKCSFNIEADGVVIYTREMDRLSEPAAFDIDVSKVNILKFQMGSVESDTFYVIMSDVYFDDDMSVIMPTTTQASTEEGETSEGETDPNADTTEEEPGENTEEATEEATEEEADSEEESGEATEEETEEETT